MAKPQQRDDREMTLLNLSNFEAEEALLGSILIDNDSIYDIGHFLKPDHFYREINRWIYEAALALTQNKTPIDLITLSAHLSERNQLKDVGGESYLIGLINTVPTSVNAVHYAKVIEGLAIRRQLVMAASFIANQAGDPDQDIEQVLGLSEQAIFDVGHKHSTGKIKSIKDVASEHMDRMQRLDAGEEVEQSISTGFTDLDSVLNGGGFERGQLIMVPGDTGMGKSSLLLDIIMNTAKDGHSAALFSLEMTDLQLFQRKVAADSRVPVASLKNPRDYMSDADWANYYTALGKLSELPVHIDETAFLTPMGLLSKCRRIKARDGLDIVGVDYLALMSADGDFKGNETLRLASISRALKLIAKELHVVMVVCAQLNSKDIAKRQNKRPQLADLRFSSDPNSDSDIVLFVYRDEYYNPDTTERPNIGEVIFGKHREGPCVTVDLYWQAVYMSFRNLQRLSVNKAIAEQKKEKVPDAPASPMVPMRKGDE